ncbi:MAG: spore coat polysaccharide biosynthesis protein SpsF [Saprospiraceae bacterium]|jgi:spore coat polysaccharide biosynthesis protein SpsF|tara:strand:+ start:1131 stop:1889 length:759 start_codon:yes stop_codon:yes gene_type:complete
MNNRIGIIIQARMGSTRLPGKVLLPFYNGNTILEILLTRILATFPKIPIIVATSDLTSDIPITALSDMYNVHSFQGSEDNVLQRMVDAARHYNIDKIIRVCADNPFLDMFYLKALIDNYNGEDYLSYAFGDGTPVIKSHLGLFAEATSLNALERVLSMTSDILYLEHVTNYLYLNPDNFLINWIPLPEILNERKDLRFTADSKEDFINYQDLFSQLKSANALDFSLEELISLVETNPNYLEIMNLEIQKNIK